MSSSRLEVLWSPYERDKFVAWGTDIYLYEVINLKDINLNSFKISDSSAAQLLATISVHQFIKCVDISSQSELDFLLAIGLGNGKVHLNSFRNSSDSGQELVPKHLRTCNCVSWNPVDANLVASGLDKHRNDNCIYLWDISKVHTIEGRSDISRPLMETGLSETAHSLSWFRNQPYTLVVGTNQKYLKMIDTRDSMKVVNTANSKCVYGVTINFHDDHQIASFADNQIAIWDARNFEKPIVTVSENKNIHKMSWCPTRQNLLASVLKESTFVHLYDIQHSLGNDEVEPIALERSIQVSFSNISSFTWHPIEENRILTVNNTGYFMDTFIHERITLNWSPSSMLVWNYGRRYLKYVDESFEFYNKLQDISIIMRQRAIADYGLKPEFTDNGNIAQEVSLKKLWNFLNLSKSFAESKKLSTDGLPGVRTVLKISSNEYSMTKSDVVQIPWLDLRSKSPQRMATVYRSEDRSRALELCGWSFSRDPAALNLFLDQLQRDGHFSKAAAIAMFHLKLRFAVDILFQGSQINPKKNSYLNVVAIALAGFSDETNAIWQELCVSSSSKLPDPYLRAMFAFLTSDVDSYERVLSEVEMAVEDRVAFACVFLSNSKLCEYIHLLTKQLTEEGTLDGILLTGTREDGINLFQKYLDLTGDVQTVSAVAMRTFKPELLELDIVQGWIESYRNLLDVWRLWNQRAEFDICMSVYNPCTKLPQQVYVSCNFCCKSISAHMQGSKRAKSPFSRVTAANTQKLKMSSCPQCRKPLPRCAVCLINMGTPSGIQWGGSMNSNSKSLTTSKVTEFSSWFTWCQSCRHGGHAGHMIQWFKEHTECPVTGCICHCLSIDSVSRISSK